MAPLILVAIDVGMTCTGVCYAVTDNPSQFFMIQRWPGSSGASADKVPTVICYRNGRFSSWGFETQQEDFSDPALDVGEWFKVYLDRKEYRDAADNTWPRSYEDVKRAYRDFLRQVYTCLREELETAVLRGLQWEKAQIEFIFSVPTTWTAMAVTATFEALIHEAGFGSEGPDHKVVIGLTEAEAAAIHTFETEKQAYSNGQVVLVVDAGGGTTDLALLIVTNTSSGQSVLRELDNVRGLELGSVEIDIAFEDMVYERLLRSSAELGMSDRACAKAARKMARESFKPHKENFGSEMSDRQTIKRIDIPGLSDNTTITNAGIRDGGLIVTNADIQNIFDRQVDRIIQLVDHQMDKMQDVAPNNKIASCIQAKHSFMILSGGLGSSQYVRKRLVHRQAAPMQGLLFDRLNRQRTGSSVISERISRFSIGVICDRLYDAAQHVGQPVYVDRVDGQRYAQGQIVWFVKKGQKITDQTLNHKFYRTLNKDGVREPWISNIVLSHNAKAPLSVKDDGVVRLCQMTSDLTKVNLSEFIKHKKKWYACDSTPTWYSTEYEVRFRISAAGQVGTELWFKDNKYSEPNSFKLEWQPGVSVSAPREVVAAVNTNYDRFRH